MFFAGSFGLTQPLTTQEPVTTPELALIPPLTSSFWPGAAVPTPTLPGLLAGLATRVLALIAMLPAETP